MNTVKRVKKPCFWFKEKHMTIIGHNFSNYTFYVDCTKFYFYDNSSI